MLEYFRLADQKCLTKEVDENISKAGSILEKDYSA